MTPAQMAALAGIVQEMEESRDRQKAETRFQRDVMARAKKLQLDTKAVRKVLQRRAEDPEEREAFEGVVFEYENALDRDLRKAREAVEAGATVKAAALATGVPRSNLRRSLGGGGKRDSTPHDPETGVITESAAAPDLPGERRTATTDDAPATAANPLAAALNVLLGPEIDGGGAGNSRTDRLVSPDERLEKPRIPLATPPSIPTPVILDGEPVLPATARPTPGQQAAVLAPRRPASGPSSGLVPVTINPADGLPDACIPDFLRRGARA